MKLGYRVLFAIMQYYGCFITETGVGCSFFDVTEKNSAFAEILIECAGR